MINDECLNSSDKREFAENVPDELISVNAWKYPGKRCINFKKLPIYVRFPDHHVTASWEPNA